MPARQPFDDRHLRNVVLAQSDEIRATQRFSGLQILSRPVVALAAIVAIVAIALGIKDYVGQNPNSPADTNTPTVENAKAVTRPKKSTSGKAERTRTSATEATAGAQASTGAVDMEKPLIAEQSADARAQRTPGMENNANTLTAQAVHDEREAAIDRDDGVPNERDAITKRGSSACLPLPNGTRPEDVDAPYYFGWATEYCGHDLSRPSAHPKGLKSHPSK